MARPKKAETDMTHIAERPDGRWRIDLVRKMPSGLQFRRTTVKSEKADAIAYRDRALEEYRRALAGEAVVSTNGYTVETWCRHCLDNIMRVQASRRGTPYSSKTIAEYRTILDRHIAPIIGNVRLSALSVENVNALLALVDSEPLRLNIHKAFSAFMQMAEGAGRIPRNTNPCRNVRIARTKTKRTDSSTVIRTKEVDSDDRRKRIAVDTPVPSGLIVEKVRVLTFEEESNLLEHVRNHPIHSSYSTLILLGLRLGLRIGEVLGLDWSAIDFDSNLVTVEQQASRIKGQKGMQVGDTKTVAGTRKIPMPKSLAEHLTVVKLLSTSAHVVCNRNGQRRDAARVHNRIKELMEGCGLNDKVEGQRFLPRPTFHDLRRTCLTRLATGYVGPNLRVTPVPPPILIRISGHEDVSTLLSYYTTADDGMVVAAMAQMP